MARAALATSAGNHMPATSAAAAPKLADHSADRRMLLLAALALAVGAGGAVGAWVLLRLIALATNLFWFGRFSTAASAITDTSVGLAVVVIPVIGGLLVGRSEEHTSELQSLMRNSYAVFCLKKKKKQKIRQ